MGIKLYKNKSRKLTILILFLVFQINRYAIAIDKGNTLNLIDGEKEYIKTRGTITAATIDGAAPLHYINSKGDKKGIAISILEYIGDISGLDFECKFYKTIDEVFKSKPDIIIGVSPEYAPPNLILSNSYLEASTILFIRAGLNPSELEDKIYAGIEGGTLPEGVKRENAIEYPARIDTLEAVENGHAHYGYGNEYSITFYNIQNSFKNIVTVPMGKQTRRYSFGFLKEDPILLSIINKSIDSIDEKQMENFILEMATSIERKITPSMVFQTYGSIIIGLILLIMAILSWGIIINIKHKKTVILQNKILVEKTEKDGLTGIYNTNTAKDLIKDRLYEKDALTKDALIILDCDGFKNVNDTHGHLAGDRSLKYIAKILKTTFRDTDIVGRIGGDEFCIYMKDISLTDYVYDKCKQVMGLMGKIDEDFQLTLSIGVKIINGHGEFKEIFYQADQAMYESKRKGGGYITIRS